MLIGVSIMFGRIGEAHIVICLGRAMLTNFLPR